MPFSTLQLLKLQRILFSFLIFSIILQIGPHSWPSFSHVSGIRVDYLSPTLYVSDILVVFLFVLSFGDRFMRTFYRELFYKTRVHIFISVLFISTLFSASPLAALFGVIKIFEFIFVGIYVAQKYDFRDKFFWVAFGLGVGVISLLTLWQFFIQSSVGGMWYFLGERTFTAVSLNIATMHINNSLMVRPYATFPHPNVLAFYLLVGLCLFWVLFTQKKHPLIIFILALGSCALFFTFSRVILFEYLIFLTLLILGAKVRHKKYIILAGSLLFIGFLFMFASRFFNLDFLSTDWGYRMQLNGIALKLFFENILFGIGINNFYIHELDFQKSLSPTLLQPVHNMYLLTFVQLGIGGGIVVLDFLIKTFIHAWKNYKTASLSTKTYYTSVLFLFVSALFIGMFDHFLLTLQQGELLCALVMGLVWNSHRFKKM